MRESLTWECISAVKRVSGVHLYVKVRLRSVEFSVSDMRTVTKIVRRGRVEEYEMMTRKE